MKKKKEDKCIGFSQIYNPLIVEALNQETNLYGLFRSSISKLSNILGEYCNISIEEYIEIILSNPTLKKEIQESVTEKKYKIVKGNVILIGRCNVCDKECNIDDDYCSDECESEEICQCCGRYYED